uniref:Ral transcription factor IIIC subunit 1 n=1 Tax=Myripristis murdjan TaxID=586833 RepID=A0A667WI02_9TELE
MDALGIVEDEVALEGLDGITIPSLWIRLEDRHPAFPLKLDTHTKEFIWRSLTSNGDLKFYELPQERGDVVLFDRFLEVDPETGIQQAERLSASTNDVYPVSVITEDKNGIQGSCVFYKERKDVTRNVRNSTLKSLVTLEEAFKRFGRKLVVVASQATRFRALVGPEGDPELKLSDHSYCILERLGRARWQGELQRDLHTFSFKTDAGKLHYMRKSLVRHGLITMQSHVIRTPSGQQQHSILLLLNRFHVNRRSKYDILMENMSNILQKTPGQVAPMLTLKELLKVNEKTLKRIYQYMQSANLVQLVRCALEDVNPTAEPCTTKKGTKVLVRCLKLVKPYKKKVIMVEDDEDDDEEDEIGVRRKSLPSEGRIMERDILLQAYDIIVACGTRGISQTALAMRMSIGKLESRMICRKLERDGIIKGFMEDVGRQRTTKFISHNRMHQRHETYRLLKRKNMIVEAVHSLKIIEGLYPLQKMINEEERQDGVSTKCCKKSILRLIRSLSREGMVKLYTTTVIQDGITKKVEMVVHPSIQPNDDAVKRAIDQIRFRISSSYPVAHIFYCFTPHFLSVFFTVKGLSRTLGFQPKMHRLRVIHNFLWYLIYGHPLKRSSPGSQTLTDTNPGSLEKPSNPSNSGPDKDVHNTKNTEKQTQSSKNPASIFVDEETWKRFIPPIPIHKDFGDGWALVSDLLLCLPLSLFIQVIQVNFKVNGLEAFLSDPVKQHYLVRALPSKIKRQLLYKRKYIFTFHENLQKLAYMGLLQFGPIEKFQDKDQVFVYLRQNTTIVDTTSSEPHYWMVSQSPDKPFEKRQYVLASSEDVENYWFDLLCVCLNTPLGTCIYTGITGSFCRQLIGVYLYMYTHRGSREVCDDGSIPGDGRGAGGLHSEFFAHLKRNWLWTNSLLAVKKVDTMHTQKIEFCQLLCIEICKKLLCLIHVAIEPASRNQQVVGGKRQKRKRGKKDVVKIPRKKRKEPKKRTPAHDEADHRALTRMTRQRVYWSLQEDSLMMLCSVASHLLNSKLKRPFIPHCVVRDLLQAEFEKSMDKTSVAVGRRTRYILKNPQTLLNYRICLAEVYQDKSLMKLLEQKKPANPDKPEDCAEAFSEYTKLLRQKFSSAMTPSDIIIPDTKQELFSSTEDIHVIVLNNLIQSTLGMSNSQMKSSRSFQTFHMYSRYCQEVLCQVFIQCRKRGLVNRRRVCKIYGPKKNRALPILPMSYQLSQSYYRCFAWRFPFALCTDVFRFLRSLINNGTGDDKPLTTFYHETEKELSDMLRYQLDSPGGACAAALSLMTLGLLSVHVSIPKQVVVVDSNLVDNEVVKSMAALEEEEDDDDDTEDCEGRKRLEVKAHQASHTNYLMMRGYCCPGIVKLRNLNTSDSIVVESCIMKFQLRSTPAHQVLLIFFPHCFSYSPPLDLSKCGPSLLPPILTHSVRPPTSSPSLSHVEECNARLIHQRDYSPQDIEACAELRRSLDEAGENGLSVQDLYEAHTHLAELHSGRTRSLQQYMQDLKEEGEVLEVGGLGVRWVLMHRAGPWLLTTNSKPWSQSQLSEQREGGNETSGENLLNSGEEKVKETLPEEKQEEAAETKNETQEKGKGLKEVEGEQTDIEHRTEEGDDATCSPPARAANTEDEHTVSFISRPWRMVDGQLNRPVCKGMLEGVLYHIMSRPGLTQQTLVEHYKNVLQPVVVLDLVQALIDMGCVKKRTLVPCPKPSLFSRPVDQAGVRTATPDRVFYEPTVSCCLRLAQVLPNEPHWNQFIQ